MTILLQGALSAQHLPPHARACSIRFGAISRSTVSALHGTCHQQYWPDCLTIANQPGGAQPCLLHVTAHHSHTIAAAQPAIHQQPSLQCRQASWVPPRQGRQPPSGRCALGLPKPSRLPPRCCRLPACASARPPWEVLSVPALADTRPPCPDRWTPSETPSCPCCQPVSHCLHILHRLVLHAVAF